MQSSINVGIFDSGIGGLSVFQKLHHLYPHANYHYLADSKFNPYGQLPHHQIIERSKQITEFFISKAINTIVIACNTATTHSISTLRNTYKQVNFIGIEPGLNPAINLTKSNHIAVMATPATFQSIKYKKLKSKIIPKDITLIEDPSAGLVELIEQVSQKPLLKEHLKSILDPINSKHVDTLVLACTHFCLIENTINQLYPEITTVNPTDAVAKVAASKLPSISSTTSVQHHFYTTSNLHHFRFQINRYLPKSINNLQSSLISLSSFS